MMSPNANGSKSGPSVFCCELASTAANERIGATSAVSQRHGVVLHPLTATPGFSLAPSLASVGELSFVSFRSSVRA